MLIYLDESGDMGFDFANRKPSRYFVITLLICNNAPCAKHIERSVRKTLKNKLHKADKKNSHQELKGSNSRLAIKQYFFRQINHHDDWQLATVVLDKLSLFKQLAQLPNKHRIYNYLSCEALRLVNFTTNIDRLQLIVDRSKSRQEMRIFNQFIVNHLESRLPLNAVLNIIHEHSHKLLGLQAVDMFSWGIFRYHEQEDSSWYDLYQDRLAEKLIVGLGERM